MAEDWSALFWFIVVVTTAAYSLTAIFLSLVREDNLSLFDDLSLDNELKLNILGPFSFGLTYILPLDYEKWGLSKKAIWIGRALWILNVLYLIIVVLILRSILRTVF